jgi:hypothetical protein
MITSLFKVCFLLSPLGVGVMFSLWHTPVTVEDGGAKC